MGKRLSATVVAVVISACATPYTLKNYEPGKVLQASIGSPLTVRVDGTKTGANKIEFTRELIYGGLSDGTIKLVYREFGDGGMARPAFTQNLQYDLKDSDIIAFQTLRLKVLAANNESIKVLVMDAAPETTAPLSPVQPAPSAKRLNSGPKKAGENCQAASECGPGLTCTGGHMGAPQCTTPSD